MLSRNSRECDGNISLRKVSDGGVDESEGGLLDLSVVDVVCEVEFVFKGGKFSAVSVLLLAF
jgi:hypothetical protein